LINKHEPIMVVLVKLYGTIRRFSDPKTPGTWEGEVPVGSSVKDLIKLLKIPIKELAIASMGGIIVDLDVVIPENSEIILVTHVGAG
jgi:hypothetical protein